MIPAELTDPRTGGYRLPWHDVFRQYDPEQFEAYRTWQASLVNHKELDRKTHELIVIAIDALVAWPSPFIDVHIHGAFDAGATIQEVLESILVAAQFGGGHVVDTAGAERFHLVGESIGGTAAIAFALAFPERVSSLTLSNAAARGGRIRNADSWRGIVAKSGQATWARQMMD